MYKVYLRWYEKNNKEFVMKDNEIAKICNALSSEIRIKIIRLLSQGEKCACEILENLKITQPTLSYHMKLLSDCNLVSWRQEGKWKYYKINCPLFREYKHSITSISCPANLGNDKCQKSSCQCIDK